ncbi:hypothetical protein PSTG_01231 [Puccinia striiformis f. sp. tritici PST-78]|uniref:Uncharacterized protein n=1 Tax=Puccinia striiformis f. sp. tritici PST-78 TaxID=1165861 RepID=A0A0L0W2V3_9BASI|nr:hypothetical protein PSTG_01231 [Puccinia striiformis f. sp. tritici PST-78]
MEGTSQLNNGNKTLNTLNMVGNAARNNTASAPQQQNEQENSARLAAELFPILAPMDMDNNYLNFSQDTGVLPAEVNSHATSLATRIAGITASHRPNSTQERVTMDERTTTIEERMRTEALPSPTPTPSIRSRQREQNSQINCYSNQDKIDELVTVFDQQFNMFLRARRARRDTMIRGILNSYSRTDQEISAGRLGTPLQQLDPQRRARDVGTRDGGEQISEDPNEPSSNQTIHNDSSTPSTGAHKQPATNCHRAERPFTHTVYQDHGLGQNQGFNRGPPPPPPSPPPQQRHFMHKQQQADVQEQHHQAHHQPQHPFNKEFHRQPQFKQGFQGEFQGHQPPQAHQPPHHHHPYAREAGAWRGSRKNWRNNSDPITQTMEIGEWSMGAESFEAGCRG